ncbi:hypothetical protein ETD86_49000 [Nonomuraea turkmeniaca]|uniref:Uncharacterized protein n=1 Tax=Nonomuraea turkmeniaca TaxID=103838 RepID=A0A5S4EWY6_9ACTN|nr:hypothetical protein [Nonomuraea turkmeniaca]TMR08161.1 hypothetical protein ETD86_49000 [Nonomuraea turkmeniaca]
MKVSDLGNGGELLINTAHQMALRPVIARYVNGGVQLASQSPTTSKKDAAVVINVDPSLTADQRQCVEQSVAQMIARHREAIARWQAAEAQRSEPLRDAEAALVKRLKDHPEAALVLEALHTTSRRVDGMPTDSRSSLHQQTPSSGSVTIEVRQGLELFGTPFDFDWSWQDSDKGNFAPRSVSRETGVAKITAEISDVAGESTWITGHAGVGVFLTTETEVAAVARALRTSKEAAYVSHHNIGSNATSEGGTEITVMKDGSYLTSATDKRWRIRVGGNDFYDQHNTEEAFVIGEPISVAWPMLPGSGYTLNLGAWVYAEAHSGVPYPFFSDHPGKAYSEIEANLLLLSLLR